MERWKLLLGRKSDVYCFCSIVAQRKTLSQSGAIIPQTFGLRGGMPKVKVFVGNQNFCLSLTPLGARKRIKSFD